MTKIKIGFEADRYMQQSKIENQLFKAYDELLTLSESVIGIDKVDNIKALLDQPTDYLINTYWNLYCLNMPEHLDKQNIMSQQTGVSIAMIEHLKNKIDSLIKRLNKKPIINAKGIKSVIKKSDYDIYLDKSKKDHYNALNKVLDSLDELKKYTTVSGGRNLMRLIPNDLQIDGVGVIARVDKFKE